MLNSSAITHFLNLKGVFVKINLKVDKPIVVKKVEKVDKEEIVVEKEEGDKEKNIIPVNRIIPVSIIRRASSKLKKLIIR